MKSVKKVKIIRNYFSTGAASSRLLHHRHRYGGLPYTRVRGYTVRHHALKLDRA